MKKQEIKKLSKDEILKNIDKSKKDLFNFRFQKINSQVTNPSKINETKKTIPLVRTTKEYKVSKDTHRGYLVFKEGIGSQAPGVLLLPEFWGLNSDMKSKADKLASWGYVVMVADLYGGGRSTTSPDEAKKWLTAFESENQKIVYKTFLFF